MQFHWIFVSYYLGKLHEEVLFSRFFIKSPRGQWVDVDETSRSGSNLSTYILITHYWNKQIKSNLLTYISIAHCCSPWSHDLSGLITWVFHLVAKWPHLSQDFKVPRGSTLESSFYWEVIRIWEGNSAAWCRYKEVQYQIDGLVQERRNSSALAMELHLSCTNPSKWYCIHCCIDSDRI